jgi:hypothetical protein
MKQQQQKQQNQAKPTPVPTQRAQHTPSAQGRGTISMPQTAPAQQAQPPQLTKQRKILTANTAGKQPPDSEAGQQPAPRTHIATAQRTRSSTQGNTNQSPQAGISKQRSNKYTALATGHRQES